MGPVHPPFQGSGIIDRLERIKNKNLANKLTNQKMFTSSQSIYSTVDIPVLKNLEETKKKVDLKYLMPPISSGRTHYKPDKDSYKNSYKNTKAALY